MHSLCNVISYFQILSYTHTSFLILKDITNYFTSTLLTVQMIVKVQRNIVAMRNENQSMKIN